MSIATQRAHAGDELAAACIAFWKSEAAIRTEFTSVDAFYAYEKARKEGRCKSIAPGLKLVSRR